MFGVTSNAEHSKCNRTLRYDGLSESIKTKLQNGKTALAADSKTDSDFHIGYVFKLVDLDAELVMAVFSSYSEQKGNIRSLLESTVEDQKGNWARVKYELDTGHVLIPNSHYSVNDVVSKENNTFLMYWNLAYSWGLSKPTYIDGYMRTEPVGARTLILYCNYAIPDIGLAPDTVNEDGLEAMKNTVEDISKWVTKVSRDQAKVNRHIERFRGMLGN